MYLGNLLMMMIIIIIFVFVLHESFRRNLYKPTNPFGAASAWDRATIWLVDYVSNEKNGLALATGQFTSNPVTADYDMRWVRKKRTET